MSREHPFSYEIDNPTKKQQDLWLNACDNHAVLGLYPEKVCEGGGVGPEELSLWLFCNKTKIRLYKERLDALFEADGRIVNLRDRVYDD